MTSKWLAVPAVFVSLAYGQPATEAPSFDAASVKVHAVGNVEESGTGPWLQANPKGVAMRNAKLVWCLGWAYGQKDWLISGPDWTTTDRYDIVAKTDRDVSQATMKLMMRTLLAERFRLVLRHETKEFAVAVLVAGKNGTRNLTAAEPGGAPDGPRPLGGKQGPASLVYKHVSLSDFAERLGAPPPFGVGERVVDRTGLTGPFDITLRVDADNFVGGRDEFVQYLQGAIEKQFGLKIEHRRMPLDTLVVVQGTRLPVEN